MRSRVTARMLPDFHCVVACTPRGAIGRANQLPWHLPSEMRYFTRLTTHVRPHHPPAARNAVVMGRRTWQSIPTKYQPLNHRVNVVLSKAGGLQLPKDVHVFSSLPDALTFLHADTNVADIYLVGGAGLYATAMHIPSCRHFFRTIVYMDDTDRAGFDAWIPKLEEVTGWVRCPHEMLETWCGDTVQEGRQSENGVEYEIEMWRRHADPETDHFSGVE